MASAREGVRELVELLVVLSPVLDSRVVVVGDRGHRGMRQEVDALLLRQIDRVR